MEDATTSQILEKFLSENTEEFEAWRSSLPQGSLKERAKVIKEGADG